MNYTIEKKVSDRRTSLVLRDSDNKVFLQVEFQPINLYKDMRLNFREHSVPCSIDMHIDGNRCSSQLVNYDVVHEIFYETIFQFLLQDSCHMLIFNVLDPLLYNFYIDNAPKMKERFDKIPQDKMCSWLNHEDSKALIDSWNIPFNFQQLPDCKIMIVYRDSEFSKYKDSSWIKRRTELSNGKYV